MLLSLAQSYTINDRCMIEFIGENSVFAEIRRFVEYDFGKKSQTHQITNRRNNPKTNLERIASKIPAFASKHEAYRIVSSRP